MQTNSMTAQSSVSWEGQEIKFNLYACRDLHKMGRECVPLEIMLQKKPAAEYISVNSRFNSCLGASKD